jgi:hypothetical protein
MANFHQLDSLRLLQANIVISSSLSAAPYAFFLDLFSRYFGELLEN